MRTPLAALLLAAPPAAPLAAQVGLTVLDEAGDPVVGATVRLAPVGASDSATAYAVTGVDGAAVVSPSIAAPHRLAVTYVG